MTTKGPSRKQVIIPMSGENVNSFMKNLSFHVANINRLLRNAKSEVLVDYICSDPTGITIITSKVSQQSDMSIIDNYIKNSNDINSLQVDEPRLPKSKSYLKIIGIPFFPHANSQEKFTSNDIWNNPQAESHLRQHFPCIKAKSNKGITEIWHVNCLDRYLGCPEQKQRKDAN